MTPSTQLQSWSASGSDAANFNSGLEDDADDSAKRNEGGGRGDLSLRVTCDVWRVACGVWRVTCDVRHVRRGDCRVTVLSAWDQFATNEKKFGIQAQFDESRWRVTLACFFCVYMQ